MYIRSSPRGPNRDPNRTLSNELLLIIEGGIGLIVRSTSLGALKVLFTVFLGALALLLYVIALTIIGKNIGFE